MSKKVKIIETEEVIEISEPYLEVRDKALYNSNTCRYEAVGGDVVVCDRKDYHITRGQYTNFQILPCEEAEPDKHCIVLPAEPARRKTIRHINHVEIIR